MDKYNLTVRCRADNCEGKGLLMFHSLHGCYLWNEAEKKSNPQNIQQNTFFFTHVKFFFSFFLHSAKFEKYFFFKLFVPSTRG